MKSRILTLASFVIAHLFLTGVAASAASSFPLTGTLVSRSIETSREESATGVSYIMRHYVTIETANDGAGAVQRVKIFVSQALQEQVAAIPFGSTVRVRVAFSGLLPNEDGKIHLTKLLDF